jgi:hypothetical protein
VGDNVSPAPRGSEENTRKSAKATSDEKQFHFFGLSAGRFLFSWSWKWRFPDGGPNLSASPVVNVLLIEWAWRDG